MKSPNQFSLTAFAPPVALTLLALLSGCSATGGSGNSSGDPRVILSNVTLNSITSSNFLLTLSASILPPSVGTTLLNADDVFINGTTAYTTYNIPGATHMGGIDAFNIVLPAMPSRTASTTFSTSTINGLYVDTAGKITTVGATTDTTTTGFPAFLNQLTLSGSTFSAPTSTVGILQTYAGTGIVGWNSSLYAIAGANGTTNGVAVLNPTTLAQTASIPSINDPRGLGYYSANGYNSNLWVNAGGGNLYSISTSNAIARTVNIGGNGIAESKSTVQVGKTMVLASRGLSGAAIVCQNDGVTLATLPGITVAGLDPTLTVTNAVAAGPGLLFAADGEAGVYVYSMTSGAPSGSTCNSVSVSQIGIINLGSTTYSANNVRYSGGSLFVATGIGGFKVITITVLSPLLFANNDFL